MIRVKETRGYSFRQLSEFSGIPAITIQKIFSGATRNPRTATMDALERALYSNEIVNKGKAFKYAQDSNMHEGPDGSPNMLCESKVRYNAGSEAMKEDEFAPAGEPDRRNEYVVPEVPDKKQGEYTVEDYYKIPDERRVELIDGVIYDMATPSTVHQDIVFYIHMSIYNHIREKGKKCKVYEAPLDVQLNRDNRTMLQPDVMVICERDKVELKKIYGAPDFALEVLSPSTRRKDMTIKLYKYQGAGVREYWIIDPKKKCLIKYNFMDEEFTPEIFSLDEQVPLAISDNELMIDLKPVKEAIEEFE